MVDFIADTEDLTEFVDQKVVEVINNKEEEEEVIKEAFFIGPRSDHSLSMSVTHSLTNWLTTLLKI